MAKKRLRIVWWNVENFGQPRTLKATGETNTYSPTRLATIAQVINQLKPAVFVLQEVYATNQGNMPDTLLKVLATNMSESGLTGMLYPEYLGVSGNDCHSMAVFFNPKKVEPQDVLPKANVTNPLALSEVPGSSSQVYVSIKIQNDQVYRSKTPILSRFKTKAGNLLNVYSIHAKSPRTGGADSIRDKHIKYLMDTAEQQYVSSSSEITVIGGDFNGSAPPGDNWIDCFATSDAQAKYAAAQGWNFLDNTHTVRTTGKSIPWSLHGSYPSFGLLNYAYDKILLLKSPMVSSDEYELVPWIVNPILGSSPEPFDDSVMSIFGYQGLEGKGLLNNQASYGMPSLVKKQIAEWAQKPTGTKSEFTETEVIQNLYYLTDHLPIALDIIPPTT